LVNRLKQETSDFLTSHDCHWMCQAVITGLWLEGRRSINWSWEVAVECALLETE
jgi:hypothetical protein